MRSHGENMWVTGCTAGEISPKSLQQLRQLGRKRGYRVTIKEDDDPRWVEHGPNVASDVYGKVPLYYWTRT